MHIAEILAAIQLKAMRGPIQIWRIGITNDPVEAKRYWTEERNENTRHWSEWQADSLSDARALEEYFIEKGMKRGSTGVAVEEGEPWVFVF